MGNCDQIYILTSFYFFVVVKMEEGELVNAVYLFYLTIRKNFRNHCINCSIFKLKHQERALTQFKCITNNFSSANSRFQIPGLSGVFAVMLSNQGKAVMPGGNPYKRALLCAYFYVDMLIHIAQVPFRMSSFTRTNGVVTMDVGTRLDLVKMRNSLGDFKVEYDENPEPPAIDAAFFRPYRNLGTDQNGRDWEKIVLLCHKTGKIIITGCRTIPEIRDCKSIARGLAREYARRPNDLPTPSSKIATPINKKRKRDWSAEDLQLMLTVNPLLEEPEQFPIPETCLSTFESASFSSL